MRITVNGQDKDVEDGLTLNLLLTGMLDSVQGTAAAVDGEIVPRTQWEQRALAAGEQVEVVTAVQGG